MDRGSAGCAGCDSDDRRDLARDTSPPSLITMNTLMGAATNLYDQCVPTTVCILDLAPWNAQRDDQHTDGQIVDA